MIQSSVIDGGRVRSSRHGSAIILSVVAIAVISLASITVVRSHRRMNFQRSATKLRSEGRLIADGLIHREIAFSRQVPLKGQAPSDPALKLFPSFEECQTKISDVNATDETMTVEVFLYPGAPAASSRSRINITNK